jgi:hypothetical protein
MEPHFPGGVMSTSAPQRQSPKTETRTERVFKNLNPLMGAIIGLFVLALFCYAIYATLSQLDAAPVPATDTQEGYSAFDRAVQVVGLISPVLTIVLGFYFGARAGTGDAHAAAAVAEREVESAKTDADELRKLIAELQSRGGEDTQKLVAEVSSERNIAVPAASVLGAAKPQESTGSSG